MDENGEVLPAESKIVEYTTGSAVADFKEIMKELLNVVATQDWANGEARADVVVNNETVLTGVPVTYLLFLEKQLVDLHTFVSKLPVLDMGENWTFDSNKDVYVSEPSETSRSKKVPQFKVLYEATKEHPAQIEKWNEDVVVGKWKSVKFSGAMPVKERKLLVDRVKKLQDAVKFAREQANAIEVEQVNVADNIFNYLFK